MDAAENLIMPVPPGSSDTEPDVRATEPTDQPPSPAQKLETPKKGHHKFEQKKAVIVQLLCSKDILETKIPLDDRWVKEIVVNTWHMGMPTQPDVACNIGSFSVKESIQMYNCAILAHASAFRVDEACEQCRGHALFGDCRINSRWPVVPACTSCGGQDRADSCSFVKADTQGQKIRAEIHNAIRAKIHLSQLRKRDYRRNAPGCPSTKLEASVIGRARQSVNRYLGRLRSAESVEQKLRYVQRARCAIDIVEGYLRGFDEIAKKVEKESEVGDVHSSEASPT
ncbi:hypothetical protein KEM56_007206 [Ascosphaera pollenicola]|nr:hypothetical protein KEM56_007206 [Ascosphaera pollenicola]